MRITDQFNDWFETKFLYGYWEKYFKEALELALTILIKFVESKIDIDKAKVLFYFNLAENDNPHHKSAIGEKAWNRAIRIVNGQLRYKI